MKVLHAYTDDGLQAHGSGYHRIASYLQGSKLLVRKRAEPDRQLARIAVKLLRRVSFSRWCSGGSFALEKDIRTELGHTRNRIVHYLWCDRDLAFLDLRSDLRLVGTFHHPPNQLDKIIQRPRALSRFKAIIIMSESQRSWFESRGVGADRIRCIHHGVDTSVFRPLPQHERSGNGLQVLAVGSTGRNFPLLAEAAKTAPSHVQFRILGPSHLKTSFNKIANVTFEDRVPDSTLISAYQEADVLLHLTTEATANNVTLEALSCGTPIVANAQGGIPEYLHSDSAFLLPRNASASEVVDQLRTIDIRSPDYKMRRLAARAHAEVQDWSVIAAQTEEVYENLPA